MNGSGYPKGLVGEEIGIFGRMSGIVDCFARSNLRNLVIGERPRRRK